MPKRRPSYRLRTNGSNIVDQQPQQCWMLHVASACTPCCVLLEVVVQSLIPVKLLAPSKRTQHCWATTPTMLDVTCCVCVLTLLRVVGSCRAKFDTGQTFSPVQTDATLLGNNPNNAGCYMLRLRAHPVACCWKLSCKV